MQPRCEAYFATWLSHGWLQIYANCGCIGLEIERMVLQFQGWCDDWVDSILLVFAWLGMNIEGGCPWSFVLVCMGCRMCRGWEAWCSIRLHCTWCVGLDIRNSSIHPVGSRNMCGFIIAKHSCYRGGAWSVEGWMGPNHSIGHHVWLVNGRVLSIRWPCSQMALSSPQIWIWGG